MKIYSKKDNVGSIVTCSDCFNDQGLHLYAEKIGLDINAICPNCGSRTGKNQL